MMCLVPPDRDCEEEYRYIINKRSAALQLTLKAASRRVFVAYGQYRENDGNAMSLQPVRWRDPGRRQALEGNYETFRDSPRYGEQLGLGNGRCPMCGFGEACTLDHYLPKAKFPEFSILPLNLVPVCGRCNQLKGTHVSDKAELQFFHAFFDGIIDVPLLKCSITMEDGNVKAVDYAIRPTHRIAANALAKMTFQFQKLKLRERFCSEAMAELGERRATFAQFAKARGNNGLRECLRIESRGYAKQLGWNHWKTALFLSLANNTAFISGVHEEFGAESPAAPIISAD